jgi:hypothetical protein
LKSPAPHLTSKNPWRLKTTTEQSFGGDNYQAPRESAINIRRASEIHVSYNYKMLKMLSSLPVLSFVTPSQPLLERAKYTKLTPECMQACSHQLQQANELITTNMQKQKSFEVNRNETKFQEEKKCYRKRNTTEFDQKRTKKFNRNRSFEKTNSLISNVPSIRKGRQK